MLKRSEKRLEIKKLNEQLKEYENDLVMLEESYKVIKLDYESIVKDVFEPTKTYDMTLLKIYGHDIYEEAEEHRKKIVVEIRKNLKDTEKFMSELLVAKTNIQKAIQECEDRKKVFEAELDISVS